GGIKAIVSVTRPHGVGVTVFFSEHAVKRVIGIGRGVIGIGRGVIGIGRGKDARIGFGKHITVGVVAVLGQAAFRVNRRRQPAQGVVTEASRLSALRDRQQAG